MLVSQGYPQHIVDNKPESGDKCIKCSKDLTLPAAGRCSSRGTGCRVWSRRRPAADGLVCWVEKRLRGFTIEVLKTPQQEVRE
jgi:hypothetical protein